MIKKVSKINFRNKQYWQNFLWGLFKKAIFVVATLLIILLLKIINLSPANNVLEVLKRNINYQFSILEDGKKIYEKTISFIDNSIEGIEVFNKIGITKLETPLSGTIYKSFDQDVKLDDKIVKNNGLDIKSMSEVDPKSIIEGEVTNVELRGNKGYFVTINNNNMDITYGYLSKPYVSEGNIVQEGDLIGLLGTNKDGNKYLRLEMYIDGTPVNPMDYIDI